MGRRAKGMAELHISGIGDKFVMPKKLPSDPKDDMLRVYRRNNHLVVELGDGTSWSVSEYNAARVVGLLSLFLNLRFIPSHAKRLLLGSGPTEDKPEAKP